MNLSLNYTSFASPKVALEIVAAMAKVLKEGEVVRLKNRKGDYWLLVTIHRDELSYRFAFISSDGHDRSDDILKACIRTWDEVNSRSFWALNAESYELKEHPFVVLARKAAKERAKAAYMEASMRRAEQERAHALRSGCTVCVLSYGGSLPFYGAYQRDWLGRKRLYAMGHDGEFRKVSREALQMIARIEEL